MADDLGAIPAANWFLVLELAKKRRAQGITLEVPAALLAARARMCNLMTVPTATS